MIRPGTPEAAAFDQELADELEVADAELLALEGPDAFTGSRMLRQTALAAEAGPGAGRQCLRGLVPARGRERAELAGYLGVTVDQLAAMSVERRADPGYPLDAGIAQGDLAERFGADPERLADVLG